jgi:hypothetical protein
LTASQKLNEFLKTKRPKNDLSICKDLFDEASMRVESFQNLFLANPRGVEYDFFINLLFKDSIKK